MLLFREASGRRRLINESHITDILPEATGSTVRLVTGEDILVDASFGRIVQDLPCMKFTTVNGR